MTEELGSNRHDDRISGQKSPNAVEQTGCPLAKSPWV
jgi:hypothetical protein